MMQTNFNISLSGNIIVLMESCNNKLESIYVMNECNKIGLMTLMQLKRKNTLI